MSVESLTKMCKTRSCNRLLAIYGGHRRPVCFYASASTTPICGEWNAVSTSLLDMPPSKQNVNRQLSIVNQSRLMKRRFLSIIYRFCIHNLGILEIFRADEITSERGRDSRHDRRVVSFGRVIFRFGHVTHKTKNSHP